MYLFLWKPSVLNSHDGKFRQIPYRPTLDVPGLERKKL